MLLSLSIIISNFRKMYFNILVIIMFYLVKYTKHCKSLNKEYIS